MKPDMDVLIPARSGSVGLPGKNRRVLIDRPLALHSIAFAQELEGVRHIFFSTDDPDLAQLADDAGAYVPSLRPPELATPSSPTADVVRHAMTVLDHSVGTSTDFLLLLEPTSPLRDPCLINAAVDQLRADYQLDGAIAVSSPSFNPLWVGVERSTDGRITRHPNTPGVYTRRQDVPDYWRINGNFYLWRNSFARTLTPDWLDLGDFIGIETPEVLSYSIDTLSDFRLVEALISSRLVSVPWLSETYTGGPG